MKELGKIRVVQVLEATAGGTRRHLFELLDHLPRDEFEPLVVCSVERDPSFADDIAEFRRRDIEVRIIRMVRAPHLIRDSFAIAQIRQILSETDCDILHLHSGKAGLLGRIAALGMKCRILYSPHAFPFLQGGLLGKLAWYSEKLLAKQTSSLVAVSKAEAALAVSSGLYLASSVCILENSTDLSAHDQRVGQVEAIRGPEEQRKFALLGELRAQKAPLLFLEAARRLLARGVRAKFLLPARGPMLREAAAFVDRHHLGTFVHFHPTNQTLDTALRAMDVGVFASYWEGFPYALIDAMATRRPVIASDLPVFRDVLSRIDDRLLFRSGDANGLANAMQLWARLPTKELVDAGTRGRLIVESQHTIDVWREKLARFYRDAVQAGTASRGSLLPLRIQQPADRSAHTVVRSIDGPAQERVG